MTHAQPDLSSPTIQPGREPTRKSDAPYSEGQELIGVWRGQAAARLGPFGQVERAPWDALCDNRDPTTHETLTVRRKADRRVGYDFNFHVPKSVSLLYGLTRDERLLEVFWANHDPTTLNRQGPDYGRQYRSAIFFHTPEQQAAATASRDAQNASGRYRRPIVTEITPAQTFWRAEEYHQQYLHKRGATNCHL